MLPNLVMTVPDEESRQFKPGLNARDFRKIAPNGFGDRHNAYTHCMAWHQEHLYVGCTKANLAYVGRGRAEAYPEWLGEIWPVKIPKRICDIDLRAEIWRYHPPTDHWRDGRFV